MITNYEEAMEYVASKRESGIRFDLTRMERLMKELRHPQRKVKTIHVAGTNGKGSTVVFLRKMIEEAGFQVGTFMSPVYGDVEKQIAVNGEFMTKEDFTKTLSEMKEKIHNVEKELNETISEFELMTAAALYYFAYKKRVDLAIFEAGMGGRHDATNVIIPLVSIITNVTMDHSQYLGKSLEEVAKEKAGIIKSGVAVITGASDIPLQIIEDEAKNKKASLYVANDYFKFSSTINNGTQYLNYDAPYLKLNHEPMGMLGAHQAKNAALAVTAAVYLKQFYALLVDEEHILAGIKKASLPGKFELVHNDPTIVFDTAHNVDAIEKTIAAMKEIFPEKQFHVLFATMKDKDIEGMIEQLKDFADELTLTTFSYERAATYEDYKKMQIENKLTGVKKWDYTDDGESWLNQWLRKKEDAILLVTGSNYFVDDLREKFVQ